MEEFVTTQFDAVQEGITYNSAKFDRLEANFYEARSDISNMRADIKELTQAVRKKELVQLSQNKIQNIFNTNK